MDAMIRENEAKFSAHLEDMEEKQGERNEKADKATRAHQQQVAEVCQALERKFSDKCSAQDLRADEVELRSQRNRVLKVPPAAAPAAPVPPSGSRERAFRACLRTATSLPGRALPFQ